MNTVRYGWEELKDEKKAEQITFEHDGFQVTILNKHGADGRKVKDRFIKKFEQFAPDLIIARINGGVLIDWENLKKNPHTYDDKISILGSLGVLTSEKEGNWKLGSPLDGFCVPIKEIYGEALYSKPWKYYFTQKEHALNFARALVQEALPFFELCHVDEVITQSELRD